MVDRIVWQLKWNCDKISYCTEGIASRMVLVQIKHETEKRYSYNDAFFHRFADE